MSILTVPAPKQDGCAIRGELKLPVLSGVTVKPLMARVSPDIDSVIGRDVQLTCLVLAGNPTPRITWSRLGEPVKSTDRVVDDGRGNLYLRNVTVDDQGEYVCTASNVGGTTSNNIRLHVFGTIRASLDTDVQIS